MSTSSATITDARRWMVLAVSTTAQGAAAITIHGPAFLIPVLHERYALSLPEAATVAAAPMFGVMVSLVAWGVAVDRLGERLVLVVGLGATSVAGAASTLSAEPVVLAGTLFLAGAAAASTASASGRVVVGWFPPHRRGLAMGIRQMAQPVGVGVAAISIAVVADEHGVRTGLWVPAIAAAAAMVVVALVVVDPPRPDRPLAPAPSPYRADGYLARVHGVSVLLVVPQFVVWTFALVWLIDDRGWSPAAAGSLVAAAQVVGALGRIAVGWVSDRAGNRMRVLRTVAVGAAATMALLGLTAGLGWSVAVLLMVVATGVTVADNGLAFTAVAERAGAFWSGRALGVQNTAQYLVAAATAPVAGLAVHEWGYAATFGLAAAFPVVAVVLVPVARERPLT